LGLDVFFGDLGGNIVIFEEFLEFLGEFGVVLGD
jgi:hypothetical protein